MPGSLLPRAKSFLLGSSRREAEILRQLTDVFSELARISVDIGAVWRAVEETRAELEATRRMLSEDANLVRQLSELVGVQIDTENESAELLGRLLQSTRSRLDRLEEAAQVGA